jgi:tetratricopeptide (TPR) repeat protein
MARFILVPALAVLAILTAACSSSPSPSSSSNSLISQGLSAEAGGSPQQALKDFNQAVAQDPSNQVAYYDLGVMYQEKLGNRGQAATEYNKAILADPNYKPAIYNLAILDTSGDPTQAINLYNQLLKLNPNDSNVLFNLGLLLYQSGQTAQGQADLTKAIFLNPALKDRVPKSVTL